MIRSLAFTLAAALALPVSAQDVESLAWMAGHWVHRKDGETVRESWLGPEGGLLVGMTHTARDGRPSTFEHMRIARKDGKVVYFASPGGRPATEFPLAESGEGRAVFEKPDHDYPRRIVYERVDADTMLARIEGKRRGQDASEEWRYRRAAR